MDKMRNLWESMKRKRSDAEDPRHGKKDETTGAHH